MVGHYFRRSIHQAFLMECAYLKNLREKIADFQLVTLIAEGDFIG